MLTKRLLKSVLFTVLLLLLYGSLSAQAPSLQYGELYKNTPTIAKIIKKTDEHLISVSFKETRFLNPRLFLDTHDAKNLNFITSKEVVLPKITDSQARLNYVHYFPATDKIILFMEFVQKDKISLFAYEIDEEGNTGKGKLVFDKENRIHNYYYLYDIIPTPEDPDLLVISRFRYVRKNSEMQALIHVINSKFETIQQVEDVFPLKKSGDKIKIKEIIYNKAGFIHLIVYYGELIYSSDTYLLRSYSNSNVTEQRLNLDGIPFIENPSFTLTPNNELAMVGYYSDYKGGKRVLKGVYVNYYNPITKELTQNITPFTSTHYDNLYGSKSKKYYKGIPYNWTPKSDVVLRKDGGFYNITESYTPYVTSYNATYKRRDIIITALDATGKLEWVNRIAKFQHEPMVSIQTGNNLRFLTLVHHHYRYASQPFAPFGSYGYALKNDKLYLFYNDLYDNLTLAIDKKPTVVTKFAYTHPIIVSFDNSGIMTRTALPQNNSNGIMRPNSASLFEGELYIPALITHKEKIGRLMLP
ncbi:MAG: hypothetical protein ACRBFS_07175 [Aureispira sp.]